MKNPILLFALAACGFIHAGEPPVLAHFNFDDEEVSSFLPPPGITVSDLTASDDATLDFWKPSVGASMEAYGVDSNLALTISAPKYAASAEQALDEGAWLEFTLEAEEGKRVAVEEIVFHQSRTESSPRQGVIFVSIDGGPFRPVGKPFSSVNVSTFTEKSRIKRTFDPDSRVGRKITIRITFFEDNARRGVARIDDLVTTGALVP
jgi:hypothetical protein